MTVRFHLFPFRTQQLSSLVPKIVSWKRLVKIGSRRLEYAALRVLRAVFFYPEKKWAVQQTSSAIASKKADPMLRLDRAKEFTENSFNNRLKFTVGFDGMPLLVYHISVCEYSF